MNIRKVERADGCGNRFVIFDLTGLKRGESVDTKVLTSSAKEDIARLGADTALVISRLKRNKYRMQVVESNEMFSDMCGNGIRCVAEYAVTYLGAPDKLKIQTDAGIKEVTRDPETKQFRVKMGEVVLDPTIAGIPVVVKDHKYELYLANSGERHAVTFVENVAAVDVKTIGPLIRNHELFLPRGANVNFATVADKRKGIIKVRTFEKGVERETLSCGTGATATAFVAAKNGFVKPSRIRILCEGGELTIYTRKNKAIMEGPANVAEPITANI